MPREKIPTLQPAQKPAPRRTFSRKQAEPAVAIAAATRFVDPEQRVALIAEAAYFRAQRRGFAPGHEISDWLEAEAEVDASLLRGAAEPRIST